MPRQADEVIGGELLDLDGYLGLIATAPPRQDGQLVDVADQAAEADPAEREVDPDGSASGKRCAIDSRTISARRPFLKVHPTQLTSDPSYKSFWVEDEVKSAVCSPPEDPAELSRSAPASQKRGHEAWLEGGRLAD